MEPATFFNEKTPMSHTEQNYWACLDLDPSRLLQLKRIGWTALGIFTGTFITAISVLSVYDGYKSITAKPLSTANLLISGAEIACGTSTWMIISGLAGAWLGKCQNTYEAITDRYPNHEAYQGSMLDFLNDDLERKFDVEIWKPFLSDFLNHFEPVLLDRYFQEKNVKQEERIEHLCEELRGGCCFGYSMALLAKMKECASSSSTELRKTKLENIVYFQLVNKIFYNLNKSNSNIYVMCYYFYRKEGHQTKSFIEWLEDANFVHWFDLKDPSSLAVINRINLNRINSRYGIGNDDQTLQEVTKSLEFNRLFFNFCDLFTQGVLYYRSEGLPNFETLDFQYEKLSKQFQDAETEILEQAKESDSNKMTLAGYLDLQYDKGHAIFFQVSDGFFRFTDSGSPLNHFFEFPTKEEMIQALVDHVRTCYKDEENIHLRIVMLGIPHSSSADSVEISEVI